MYFSVTDRAGVRHTIDVNVVIGCLAMLAPFALAFIAGFVMGFLL